MNKWADYLISAIRYSDEILKDSIQYLKVHPDYGEEIGAGSTWSKDEVVNAMHDGKTFYTIVKNKTGEWKKGSIVALITKNGRFLITDNVYTEADYLAEMQEL